MNFSMILFFQTDNNAGGSGKPVKITEKKSKKIKFLKCTLI